jgi:ribosomal protein L3 glutamine methyltransferase
MFADARGILSTVRDLLRFAVSRFDAAGLVYGHGTDNAYDEAAYLILHTLHLPLDRLDPFLDARALPDEVDAVLKVLERRVRERVPAAYLTHEAWLGELRFYVDERVIVPRSHIAQLLDHGLTAWIPNADTVARALDLCTGSGCLAVLLAHAFRHASVDASDISAPALEVARRNILDYELDARVRPVESDLFAALGDQRYDVIISNPPYVGATSMQALPPEYRHEPALALAGGNDGLDVVRRILQGAKRHLAHHGLLLVEIGAEREALEVAYPDLEFTWLDAGADDAAVFLLERAQLPD